MSNNELIVFFVYIFTFSISMSCSIFRDRSLIFLYIQDSGPAMITSTMTFQTGMNSWLHDLPAGRQAAWLSYSQTQSSPSSHHPCNQLPVQRHLGFSNPNRWVIIRIDHQQPRRQSYSRASSVQWFPDAWYFCQGNFSSDINWHPMSSDSNSGIPTIHKFSSRFLARHCLVNGFLPAAAFKHRHPAARVPVLLSPEPLSRRSGLPV